MTRVRSRSNGSAEVALRILSTEGWIAGYLNTPSYALLVQELNRGDAFLRLTQASLPGKSSSYDFLALHRNGIVLIIPDHDVRAAPDPKRGRGHAHAATFLLPSAVLHATLDLSPRLRMSDFLAKQSGFFVVEQASLFERSPSGKLVRSRNYDRVLVHAPNVLGVTESSQASARVLRLARADGAQTKARRAAAVRRPAKRRVAQ